MATFKNELDNFQTINRQLIFDNTITDRARFVYCYMAAKPDGWSFFLEPMANEIGYSVDTLRKYINELIANGWLLKGEQQYSEKGQFGAVEYTLKATKNTDTDFFRHGKNAAQKEKRYNKEKRDISEDNKEYNKKDEDAVRQFEIWWDMYDKKVERNKTEAKWKKLTNEERRLAIEHTPKYVAATPDKQYRKNPQTYINNKCWNDEIIAKPIDMFDVNFGVARHEDAPDRYKNMRKW